ncbi:MAG: twin-arginine translocase TatA/TatE family subunit [Deltaproteobacteria bacterium]|nr:twin-arginine translocase TatA/TatE family subunit [Deltaproteobacteria bacterium]
MFGIGSQELIIIFLIVFFVFGAKRLPEMGKGLGQAIRGFKKGVEERPQIEESKESNPSENMAKR